MSHRKVAGIRCHANVLREFMTLTTHVIFCCATLAPVLLLPSTFLMEIQKKSCNLFIVGEILHNIKGVTTVPNINFGRQIEILLGMRIGQSPLKILFSYYHLFRARFYWAVWMRFRSSITLLKALLFGRILKILSMGKQVGKGQRLLG